MPCRWYLLFMCWEMPVETSIELTSWQAAVWLMTIILFYFHCLFGWYWGMHPLCSPWNQAQLWVRRTARDVQCFLHSTFLFLFSVLNHSCSSTLTVRAVFFMMDDHQRLLTVRAKPQRDTTQHIPQHNAHNDGRDAKHNPWKIKVLMSDFKKKNDKQNAIF